MNQMSLIALAQQQLRAAHNSKNGCNAQTIYGGHQHSLRQTVIALTATTRLADHDSPGDATLQVLQGHVRLTGIDTCCDGAPGDHLPIPQSRHSLEALEDSVVLLTVAKPLQPQADTERE